MARISANEHAVRVLKDFAAIDQIPQQQRVAVLQELAAFAQNIGDLPLSDDLKAGMANRAMQAIFTIGQIDPASAGQLRDMANNVRSERNFYPNHNAQYNAPPQGNVRAGSNGLQMRQREQQMSTDRLRMNSAEMLRFNREAEQRRQAEANALRTRGSGSGGGGGGGGGMDEMQRLEEERLLQESEQRLSDMYSNSPNSYDTSRSYDPYENDR